MIDRFWDPEGKYEGGLLKEFDHWVLEVSFIQHTLGCFIVFSKYDTQRFSELSAEAMVELPVVMKIVEDTSELTGTDTCSIIETLRAPRGF